MIFDNINIKKAFKRVKEDICGVQEDVDSLKENSSEWVQYLERNQEQMSNKILQLETRIKQLERESLRTKVMNR